MLGRLERTYGNNATYVHLKRNKIDTARSFTKRYGFGIIRAYSSAILISSSENAPMDVCMDYIDTANSNIEAFLKNKNRKMQCLRTVFRSNQTSKKPIFRLTLKVISFIRQFPSFAKTV